MKIDDSAMSTDADDKSFAKEKTLIATNDCSRRADAASEQEQSTSTWQGGELLGAIYDIVRFRTFLMSFRPHFDASNLNYMYI